MSVPGGNVPRVNPDDLPSAPGDLTADPGDPVPLDASLKPPAGAAQRPTSLRPEQLGFTPRPPVPWLSPGLLAGTAVRVGLAGLFGAYLDKRELQTALPSKVFDERDGGVDAGEVWFDFV